MYRQSPAVDLGRPCRSSRIAPRRIGIRLSLVPFQLHGLVHVQSCILSSGGDGWLLFAHFVPSASVLPSAGAMDSARASGQAGGVAGSGLQPLPTLARPATKPIRKPTPAPAAAPIHAPSDGRRLRLERERFHRRLRRCRGTAREHHRHPQGPDPQPLPAPRQPSRLRFHHSSVTVGVTATRRQRKVRVQATTTRRVRGSPAGSRAAPRAIASGSR
jgi:hypothetical protein